MNDFNLDIIRTQFIQDDKFIQKSTQDIEPILDHNKALQNDGDGYSPSRDLRRVALIPNVIVEDLMHRGIWRDKAAMRKWLNDPDNRHFRTALGRI